MHGFSQVLTRWLQFVQPTRIIEWGPGLSTELMLQHAPGAQITSIEHDAAWHQKAAEKFGDRIDLRLVSATARNSSYATTAYACGPFDLAFVDGRRRVECCLIALSLLRPGGVVILHDICRDNYMRPLRLVADCIEIRSNTAVMRPRGR